MAPTAAPPTAELARDLRLVVHRLARRLRQGTTHGLTPSQLSALATLDTNGPMRLSDLATAEGVAPPTVTRLVAWLEQQGLVSRKPDPSDGRAAVLSLTTNGRRLVRRVREERTMTLAVLLDSLDDADRKCLIAAMPVLEQLAEGA
jgi:DNA-binding MarR family transcriptional regulator